MKTTNTESVLPFINVFGDAHLIKFECLPDLVKEKCTLVINDTPFSIVIAFLFNISVYQQSGQGDQVLPQSVADDTGLGRSADLPEGREVLQRDLDRLVQWTEANSARITKAKCWVPPLGHNTTMECSKLGKEQLEKLSGGDNPEISGSLPVMCIRQSSFSSRAITSES